MHKLTTLIVYFFCTLSTFATNYFVDLYGNDSNNGTSQSTPWRTISKVNNYTFKPGDVVYFRGGQQFHGNLIFKESGSSGYLIAVTSYGSVRAEILAGTGSGIVLNNNQYFRITNIKVTGSGVNNGGISNSGIKIFQNDYRTTRLNTIYVDQVEVSGFRKVGIEFFSDSGAGYNDLHFTNNDVHHNGTAGMWCGSYNGGPSHTNITTTYCKFHDNQQLPGQYASGTGMFYKSVDGGSKLKSKKAPREAKSRQSGVKMILILFIFGTNIFLQVG